jgi:hypothetical protein
VRAFKYTVDQYPICNERPKSRKYADRNRPCSALACLGDTESWRELPSIGKRRFISMSQAPITVVERRTDAARKTLKTARIRSKMWTF